MPNPHIFVGFIHLIVSYTEVCGGTGVGAPRGCRWPVNAEIFLQYLRFSPIVGDINPPYLMSLELAKWSVDYIINFHIMPFYFSELFLVMVQIFDF